MNYNKLLNLIEQSKMTKKAIYKAVGRSHTWFEELGVKKRINVKDLEKLSKLFGVSPATFFDDHENILHEPAQEYVKSMKNMSENLQEDLKYFRERCNQLERDLSELRDKNKKAC